MKILSDDEKLRIAMLDIQNIANEKELLKGHFSLVAKRHGVKARLLKKLYLSKL